MLESFDQLTALERLLRRPDWTREQFVAPDYQKMRFKVGASLAETKVPYAMADELRQLLKKSADVLLVAIAMRHRNQLGAVALDKILLEPVTVDVDPAPESWYLGEVPQDSLHHTIISRCMRKSRLFDTGLLLWWLGKGAIGRRLLSELKRLTAKLHHEEHNRTDGEPTLHFGYMALWLELNRYRSETRTRIDDPLVQEALNAVTIAFHEMLLALLEDQVKAELPQREVGDEEALTYHSLALAYSPLVMAPGQTDFGRHAISPFQLSGQAIAELERLFPKMTERSTPVTEVARQLFERVTGDKEIPQRLLRDEKVRRLHLATLDLLWFIKTPDKGSPEAQVVDELKRLRKEPDVFLKTLEDKKRAKEWQETWKRLGVASLKPQMDAFGETIAAFSKLTTGFLSDKTALSQIYMSQVEQFILLRHQEVLTAAIEKQHPIAVLVEGEEVTEQYGKGHLYLISAVDEPVLNAIVEMNEAQLFIDLKDFTKRTFSTKELAMADFMKWEFYDPILQLSKKYQVGMAHLDRAGVQIHNLLGDAIAASGDVTSLLHFARDVFALTEAYKTKLRERIPEELLAGKLAELDALNQPQLKKLEHEYTQYKAAMQKRQLQLKNLPEGDPQRKPIEMQLRGYREAVGASERQLRQAKLEHDEKRALIQGVGMEAGIFIAYGHASETIAFQDDVFGHLKVAIGEKINECARGTARDVFVHEMLEHIVNKVRTRTRNPDVQYPFQVYVDNTLHGPLEPDLEEALHLALEKKDVDEAKRIIQIFTQRLMNDIVPNLKKEEPDFRMLRKGNGIYNLGIAVSGEAFDEFLSADVREPIRREMIVEELHPEIIRQFAFPKARYPLTILPVGQEAETDEPEVFVELGSVTFKGFEQSTPQVIYENLLPHTLFYRLLRKHHLGAWIAEAGQKPSDQASMGT